MKALRLLAAPALVFVTLVLVPSASYACSCAHSSTADHVDRADVVVRGTVQGRDLPPRGGMQSSLDPVTYSVAVAEVYKGVAPRSLEIRSVVSGASCGLEGVRVGREYVVFATQGDHLAGGSTEGGLWANLCGGTAAASPQLVSEVETAAAAGGPGGARTTTPSPPDVPTAAPAGLSGQATPAVPPEEASQQGRGLLAVGAGAVLLALAVVVRRRSRRPTG